MFGWFRRTTRRTTELEFVHRRDRFRDILEVERMRSDRTGSSFALVVFTLPRDGDDDTLPAFARHLERRRRATDHVGYMHDRHLGVVLWHTTEDGAWTYAESVVDDWRKHLRSAAAVGTNKADEPVVPEVEVFLYPTHVPRGEDEGNSLHLRDVSREANAIEDEELVGTGEATLDGTAVTAPAGTAVTAGAGTAVTAGAGTAVAVAQPQTKSLETLFVRPLPFWKRCVDVAGATFGLVVLAPLLLVVAALVKWTSSGPVFFRQRRTGHGGREFTIYKFRTMCVDAEARKAALREFSEQDGPAFKLANDPRITPIGRFLRKTCIDELPQLWNVLIGDMTLVGPRPLDVKEADQTSGWERRRLDVTPGLTCIWQVDGKSRVSFAEWMRMDIRYARVGSFWADLRLVGRTLLAMLRLKASQ